MLEAFADFRDWLKSNEDEAQNISSSNSPKAKC